MLREHGTIGTIGTLGTIGSIGSIGILGTIVVEFTGNQMLDHFDNFAARSVKSFFTKMTIFLGNP